VAAFTSSSLFRAVFSVLKPLKYLMPEEREASVTAGFDDIGGGGSNLPSDQTGSTAIYNADE